MSDFLVTWKLTRHRLTETTQDLNQAQLNWRIYPGALTIAEMLVHIAGVEVSFSSQLRGLELDEATLRLKTAATDGSVNDKPFPYSVEELTPEFVKQALELSGSMVEPLLTNPTDEIRAKQLQSALGPIIDGTGAMARLAAHPFYHQGQAYQIRNAPGFPA